MFPYEVWSFGWSNFAQNHFKRVQLGLCLPYFGQCPADLDVGVATRHAGEPIKPPPSLSLPVKWGPRVRGLRVVLYSFLFISAESLIIARKMQINPKNTN